MADNLTTWQKWSSRLAIPSIIAGVIFSLYTTFKNEQIQRENAEIRRENEEIKHNQKDEFTLRLVGMKNTATKLESGYKAQKMREAKYIEYNRRSPCSVLPADLAVAEPPLDYMPPEAVYMQILQPENHDN